MRRMKPRTLSPRRGFVNLTELDYSIRLAVHVPHNEARKRLQAGIGALDQIL